MAFRLLVTLYSPVDSDLLVSRLTDEDIEVRVENRDLLAVVPMWTVAMGGIRILVPEADHETAWQLLAKINAGDEALEPGSDRCPKCGNPKVLERRMDARGVLRAALFFLFSSPLPVACSVKRCRWCDRSAKKRAR